MRYFDSTLLISRVITLLIAFTVHEYAHALAAVCLGDDTPKRDGSFTLNPLAHLDFWGTVMLIFTGFGWAKPTHFNIQAVNRKTKAGMMLVAASGPLSNLILAIIAGLILYSGKVPLTYYSYGVMPTLAGFLEVFIIINLNLFVFNLFPISPLDGEKVLEFFIPESARGIWDNIQQYGPLILMVLFFLLPRLGIDVFGQLLSPIVRQLFRLISGGAA